MVSERKYTVSEITRVIKKSLEEHFFSVWVEGEISDFRRHSSGHYYFTLKDQNAQLSTVMWRGKNMSLFFTPEDGMKVLAKGRITVFEKSGRYQLDVDVLQPLGVGELQIAFEQLKVRLQEEGLFDPGRKKRLPAFPESIGIVTSPTGAAIRDMVSVINRRFPGIQIILYPVRVQGSEAAGEIVQALEDFNEFGGVDVLIIGRGGGSIEDLWPFNEESVARAICRSRIPVVSAVGHEIDFTIADFAADVRAPTPSAAAELVVPDAREEWEKVAGNLQRIYRVTADRIKNLNEKIHLLENSRALQSPLDIFKQSDQQIDILSGKLELSYRNLVVQRIDFVEQLTKRLKSLDPDAVLKRGYSITFRSKDNAVVTDSSQLKPGERVNLRFSSGGADGYIEQTHAPQ